MSLKNVLIGIDQLCNTLLGGTPDETLSARACRLAYFTDPPDNLGVRLYSIINKIFFWRDDHCKEAFEAEILRKQLPSVYSTSKIILQFTQILKGEDNGKHSYHAKF